MPVDVFLLEIDVWDNKKSSEEIDEAVERLIGNRNEMTGLDFCTITTEDFNIRFSLNNIQNIPDPTPDIKRRKLQFDCRVFFYN